MRAVTLLCGLLVAMTGCAAPISDDVEVVGNQASPIIHGTPTSGTPAVIALYGTKPGAPGGALCTSTLIAPRVLLTAAHCVADASVGAGARFVALIGSDLNDHTQPPRVLQVASVQWDHAFDEGSPQKGHDIGIAILAEPLTDIAPMGVNFAPLAGSLNGSKVRVVGYGLDDGIGQLGAGVKREAMVPVGSIDKLLVQTGSATGATICNGDSGGPVLAKLGGVETVIAVNSFGREACTGSANSTRVDTYAAFVKRALHESM